MCAFRELSRSSRTSCEEREAKKGAERNMHTLVSEYVSDEWQCHMVICVTRINYKPAACESAVYRLTNDACDAEEFALYNRMVVELMLWKHALIAAAAAAVTAVGFGDGDVSANGYDVYDANDAGGENDANDGC